MKKVIIKWDPFTFADISFQKLAETSRIALGIAPSEKYAVHQKELACGCRRRLRTRDQVGYFFAKHCSGLNHELYVLFGRDLNA